MSMVSNCCGAPAKGSALDYGMCPECREHCEFVSEEDMDEVEDTNELERQNDQEGHDKYFGFNDMNDPEVRRAAAQLDRFREPQGGW